MGLDNPAIPREYPYTVSLSLSLSLRFYDRYEKFTNGIVKLQREFLVAYLVTRDGDQGESVPRTPNRTFYE